MYYAVRNGRNRGIFSSWEECRKEIDGFSGAVYKKFKSYEEACIYLDAVNGDVSNNELGYETDENLKGLHIYVDGSFSEKNGVTGYGIVILYNGDIIETKNGTSGKYIEMRNVAGELFGAGIGIKWAIDNGYREVNIHYDYAGIEQWATGGWKCKEQGTVNYKKYIDSVKWLIDIRFIKVKGHSGNKYNDLADELAKEAVGIKQGNKKVD